MKLDKQEVIDLLRKEGKNEHVQKAMEELPDKIDHEQHAEMLEQKFGVDPGKLAERRWRRSCASDRLARMKGASKPKKGAKKTPQKSLKERRAEKKAAADKKFSSGY